MSTTLASEMPKVAKLYKAICDYSDPEITKQILEKSVDVNYRIPGQSFPCDSRVKIECNTLLHVAYAKGNLKNFKLLLQHGADFTVKDRHGSTILHSIIKNYRNIIESSWKPVPAIQLVDAVLSAHIDFGCYTNPCNEDGLSHFHVAVALDNVEAMKLFLNNGVSVDHSTNMDSLMKPGYSPLHFAAENGSVGAASLLMSHGANMHRKNAKGMTPLHLLVEQRLDTFFARHTTTGEQYIELQEGEIKLNEQIIIMILENDSTDIDCTDNIGLSKFHIVCTLLDSSVLEHLLDRVADVNQRVNEDSPFWSGYTGLHFAAHCSVDIVKTLIEGGADMTARDAKGTTPLDICMGWFRLEDVYSLVLSWPQLQNVTFSNSRTRLLDCILAMLNSDKLKKFLRDNVDLNVCLPKDSPLWPGSAPLHLAFQQTSRTNMVRSLLEIQGRAWKEAANPSDENGLTYLHVACTDDDRRHRLATKILSMRRSVRSMLNAAYQGPELRRLKPGWTPLHIAVHEGRVSLTKALLERGADVNCQDAEGFSPVHRCMFSKKEIADLLLGSKQLKECMVEAAGLTHLHVATWLGNTKAVTRLLRMGANVEATITGVLEGSDTKRFVGCTPIHLAMIRNDLAGVKLLLKFGADVLARRADGVSPLSEALTTRSDMIAETLIQRIRDDEQLRKRLEAELGLTMLHVACTSLDHDEIETLLKIEGTDVNAKTRDDLNFWPGFTPLHVLVESQSKRGDIHDVLELLLKNGADVTAKNAKQCTPVHLALRMYKLDISAMNLMLQHQRDFSVDPVDEDGLSHFHCACAVCDVNSVAKFLLQGHVDVNRQVDLFASRYAGYSPLHFVLDTTITGRKNDASQMRIVELLLAHGAKVKVEDSRGYTPLHVLIQNIQTPQRFSLMRIIINFCDEKDVDMRTIAGQTPIEILLSAHNLCKDVSVWLAELKLLISRGGQINTCNPVTGEGYLGLAFSCDKYINIWNNIVEIIESASGCSGLDEQYRNSIHNVVAAFHPFLSQSNYEYMINKSIQHGCDIDQQDCFGRTALHLAVKFKNINAVIGLFRSGADINVVDSNGASAFSYIFAPRVDVNYRLASILALHVHKLKLIGIEVSNLNENLLSDAIERRFIDMEERFLYLADFFEKVRDTKDIKIGRRGIPLRSFLFETAAISAYPSLTLVKRDEVIAFFESLDYSNYQELQFAIKLQYRKVVQRISLIAAAEQSFNALLDFSLPDLCVKVVLKFLGNSDLKSLIATFDDEDDMDIAIE